MPKRRTVSAASSVVSASCSAVGLGVTWVSQRKEVPRGRMRTMHRRRVLERRRAAQDDVEHDCEMGDRSGRRAADHGVGLAALDHQRGDDRGRVRTTAPGHIPARRRLRSMQRRDRARQYSLKRGSLSGIDQTRNPWPGAQPEAEALEACWRPPGGGRSGSACARPSSTSGLHRAQHALLLALGVTRRAADRARARSNSGFITRPERKTNWFSRLR